MSKTDQVSEHRDRAPRPYCKPELTRYQQLEQLTKGFSPPGWEDSLCSGLGECGTPPTGPAIPSF